MLQATDTHPSYCPTCFPVWVHCKLSPVHCDPLLMESLVTKTLFCHHDHAAMPLPDMAWQLSHSLFVCPTNHTQAVRNSTPVLLVEFPAFFSCSFNPSSTSFVLSCDHSAFAFISTASIHLTVIHYSTESLQPHACSFSCSLWSHGLSPLLTNSVSTLSWQRLQLLVRPLQVTTTRGFHHSSKWPAYVGSTGSNHVCWWHNLCWNTVLLTTRSFKAQKSSSLILFSFWSAGPNLPYMSPHHSQLKHSNPSIIRIPENHQHVPLWYLTYNSLKSLERLLLILNSFVRACMAIRVAKAVCSFSRIRRILSDTARGMQLLLQPFSMLQLLLTHNTNRTKISMAFTLIVVKTSWGLPFWFHWIAHCDQRKDISTPHTDVILGNIICRYSTDQMQGIKQTCFKCVRFQR